jgi:integration host factor subunit alpha
MSTEHTFPDSDDARTTGTATRVNLCDAVYLKVGLSRAESAALVELVLKEITACLERGETVKLSSFGSRFARKDFALGAIPRPASNIQSPRDA